MNNPTPKELPPLSELIPSWIGTGYFPPIRHNQQPPYKHPQSQTRKCIWSPYQEGQVLVLYHSCNFNQSKEISIYNHTYPSNPDLPFSVLTPEPKIITNQQLPLSISSQMLSLSMLWPCTTLQQTSHNVIGLMSNVMCSTA